MRSHTSVRVAIMAALFSTPTYSQEAQPEEVVVTATALQQSAREVAQPTAVVSGDQLRRQIESTLGETLAREPGISASYFGPSASRPIIRGLGGERVLMLQDGVSALDVSSLSQDHAASIEPVLAEQIEILKGPATLLFGSGAVAGAINVVDGRIPHNFEHVENGGAIELRGDTALDERTAVGRLDLGTQRVRVHVNGFTRNTSDVEIPGFAFTPAQRAEHVLEDPDEELVRGRLDNSASEADGAALGFSTGGARGFLGMSWGRFDTQYGVPAPHAHGDESNESEEEHTDVRIDMNQDRYDFKARRELGSVFQALRFRGTYSEYTHRELEGDAVGTEFRQDAYDVRINLDHSDLAGWRGTWGSQYVQLDFAARGEEAFIPPSLTRQWALFAFEKRELNSVSFELGARAEHQSIEAQLLDAADYEDEAYSFSTGIVWNANDRYALSGQITRSQRHPQASELFADGTHLAIGRYELGNPHSKIETANTLDLTLHRHVETGVHWSIGAFYNAFDDFIYSVDTGEELEGLPVFQYTQADARFYGFEAELTLPLHITERSHFEARLASDYVRGKLNSGGNLPQMPPLRYGVELHWERDRLHVGLQTFRYAQQDQIAPGERPSAAYTMLDADLSYRFDLGSATVLAFVRGSNLLDEDARRHSSPLKEIAPLPGRSLHAGVRMEF